MRDLKSTLRGGLSTLLGPERSQQMAQYVGQNARKVVYDLSPSGAKSKKTLANLANEHKGQRCVIIGNGPSLRDMDLSLIRDEFTFGLNRIYLNFEKMGFETSCLVCVNPNVTEQWGSDFDALNIPKFFDWGARKHVQQDNKTTFVRSVSTPNFYKRIPEEGIWQGGTVTFVALQLAYYMGFKDVVLIGVDHSFSTTGTANKLVTSTGDDPNHFHPDYFGAGAKWQLPDLETSEVAYHLARRAFENDGRRVTDATVGGKLTIFPKASYSDLFLLGAKGR